MTERPILFSAPMVRAILAGTKTQTRRVVKPQPSPELLADYAEIRATRGSARTDAEMLSDCLPCPYGQPGDRLWVRETHAPQPDCWGSWERWTRGEGGPGPVVHYKASNESAWVDRWRPSIHMPRWASRINLEITDVRAERLQAITRGDAMAEGCPFPNMAAGPDPRDWYRELWSEINGPDSWPANPWVWVDEFKRLIP